VSVVQRLTANTHVSCGWLGLESLVFSRNFCFLYKYNKAELAADGGKRARGLRVRNQFDDLVFITSLDNNDHLIN
jgi:hypothetical protein